MKELLDEYGQIAGFIIIGLSIVKIFWSVMQAVSY